MITHFEKKNQLIARIKFHTTELTKCRLNYDINQFITTFTTSPETNGISEANKVFT